MRNTSLSIDPVRISTLQRISEFKANSFDRLQFSLNEVKVYLFYFNSRKIFRSIEHIFPSMDIINYNTLLAFRRPKKI